MNHTRNQEFKVIFLGPAAVGKTSIILRIQHNVFFEDHQSTVGASYVSKVIDAESGRVTLNLWDTAGQERYHSLVPMYTKSAAVAVVVFDQSQRISFDSLPEIVAGARREAPEDCEFVLVGNKSDLDDGIQKEVAKEWAAQNSLRLLFVSAKTGDGIDALLAAVVEAALKRGKKATVVPVVTLNENESHMCC